LFFWCIADETLLLLMEDCISHWARPRVSNIILLFLCAVGCCFLFSSICLYCVGISRPDDIFVSIQPEGCIRIIATLWCNRKTAQSPTAEAAGMSMFFIFLFFQQSNYKEREREM
jgi:hypothetical protein